MANYSIHLTIMLGIISTTLESIHGAKIIVLPFPGPSHVSQATIIGDVLIKDGHDVYMILPTSYPLLDKVKGGPVKVLTNHVVEKDFYSYDLGSILELNIGTRPVHTMRTELPGFRSLCPNLLSDQKLLEKLDSLKPDLFLMDSLPYWHCAYVLPYKLGLPYVSYGSVCSPYWTRAPVLPSSVPFIYGRPYTNQMNFWERLENLLSTLEMAFFPSPPYNTENWCGKYAANKPLLSLNELVEKSLFWFSHTDRVVDYPRPTMPNEAFIGDLTTGPAKPLSSALEKIVSSAKNGVIIMSFGSGMGDVNSDRFLNVFSRLTQVVIWRHMSDYQGSTPVPKNVHMLKWLPQNDLLGHNNTRLFITHGGANGQFEAVYHGVPMISFPSFAEQPYNAKRMVYHGFGRALNLMSFTEYDLYESINEVLNNPVYKEKVQKASRILRQQKPAKETIVYWVNHILNYGAQHLRSYALEMPWYSYWMLDILAFLIISVTLSMTLCCFALKLCCSRRKRKHKTD